MTWPLSRKPRSEHTDSEPSREPTIDEVAALVFPGPLTPTAVAFYESQLLARKSAGNLWDYSPDDVGKEEHRDDWYSEPHSIALEWPPLDREDYWCIARDWGFEEIGVLKNDGRIVEVTWAGAIERAATPLWRGFLFGYPPDKEYRMVIAENLNDFLDRLRERGWKGG